MLPLDGLRDPIYSQVEYNKDLTVPFCRGAEEAVPEFLFNLH
jgi:hypothetical protein